MTSLRDRAAARPRVAVGCALVLIVVVSTVIRILLNRDATGPWIFIDEMIYSELGRSAFDGFKIRGVPINGYGYVYPLVISPAYLIFDNLIDAYTAVKAINALVMSLTAIPVYFIARTIMRTRWGLAAAALAVAIPAMTYTSVVMTESVFYPVFALAMLFVVLALSRPTVVRQLLVFVGTLLCFETRPQGAIIVPAFAFSILLFAIFDARASTGEPWLPAFARRLGRYWLSWLLLFGGAIAVVVLQSARGKSLSSLLGAYSIVAEDQNRYQLRSVVSWYLQHIAELDLWLGVIPFAALLFLFGFAACRSATREVRIFAAAALPIVLLMTAIVSAFAVFANVSRIEERNLFYVGFLALIAVCWWVSEGLPRQSRWFVIGVAAAAVMPVALPFGALINQTAVSDTFGLFLPWAIQNRLMDPFLTPYVVAGGGLAAVAVLVFVRPRFAWIIVAVVASFFVISGIAVDKRTDKASQGALRQGISVSPDWIDNAVPAGTSVSVLYPGTLEPLKVWENEFFNRSLDSVYAIGVALPGQLPETVAEIGNDGSVTDRSGNPLAGDFVLSDSSVHLDGEVIATDKARGMSVVRTSGQWRISEAVSGVMGDQWSGAEFTYLRYRCTGGTVRVVMASDSQLHPTPVTVTPVVADQDLRSVAVGPTGETTLLTKLVPADGLCAVRYRVDPTAVPALVFGAPDTRALGVLVRSVEYVPTG